MGFKYSQFEVSIRKENPGLWVVLGKIIEDDKRGIKSGHVIVASNNIQDLDEILSNIPPSDLVGADIIPPQEYGMENDINNISSLDYKKWKRIVINDIKGIRVDLLLCHIILNYLFVRPHYNARLGAYLYWVRDRFVRRCHKVDGFSRTLLLTGSNNSSVANGAFQELTRLYGMTLRNWSVAAVGKLILVPGFGKTDIDVLTTDGLWCESKRLRHGLYLDKEICTKMEKMAAARDASMEVSVKNSIIKINRLLLANTNRISRTVIERANSLGIETQQNAIYGYRPF